MISFIITTWNCRKQIQNCLESLEKQSYRNFETIVIDQASIDGTAQYLKSVQERFNLSLICRTTKGTWAMNNEWGISMAKGNWLAISNPDIIFPEGSLEKIADFCYSHIVIIGGCHLIYPSGLHDKPRRFLTLGTIFFVESHRELGKWIDKKLLHNYFRRQQVFNTDNAKGTYFVGQINASFFVIPKHIISRVIWDKRYRWVAADSDLLKRASSLGIKQIYNHDIILIHEGEHSKSSMTSPEYEFERSQGFALYTKLWNHTNFLKLLFVLDALIAPFLLRFAKVDSLSHQFKVSIEKVRGLFHA